MLNKISEIMKKMYENKILEIPDNNNYKGNWDDVTGLFTPEREITSWSFKLSHHFKTRCEDWGVDLIGC